MTLSVVKRYLIAFDQYKWVGLATLATTVGVSGVVALQPTPAPVYVASGTLSYLRPTVIFSSTTTKIQQEGQEITKDMLLDKENVIEPAAKKANVSANKLKDDVQIKMPSKNNDPSALIQVLYKDADRKKAEKVLETLMNAMVDRSQNINTSRLRDTIAQIQERLPKVTQELREAEAKLEAYEKREGTSILAALNGTLPQAITGSQQQQRQLRVQLGGIEAQINSLQDRLGLNVEQAYVAQALSADPIIAQLRVQLFSIESQLKILRSDLQEEHPKIVELLKQKQAFDEQLQQRQSEVLGGNGVAAPLRSADRIRVDSSLDPARQQLAQNLIALQTQREMVQQQLKGVEKTEQLLRQEHATIPNKQLEQARLVQQVGFKKALYDKMQSALVDAEAAVAETTGSLTIAQLPKTDDVESSKRGLPVMLAVGDGVGVPFGIVAGQAWECEPKADLSEYHRQKTGSLFAAATVAGAAASGHAEPELWRLLGDRLGEAYQVADDLRDAVEDEATLGKPVGVDKGLGRPSAVAEFGLMGAVARLRRLSQDAVDSIPACRGQAVLRGLILAEAGRLLPQKLAAA
ncbi:polyprenyl synthetase family protein [Tychonema sp. LEGE 07203]|uniref:polyprenyl synthetase family protein n=1 Tax=Tychonema sp. LEGE 07203 TaxID=1828671 RepID=UPI0018817EA1|nr:polyprenyl synthetase family protein [Tychonema sp. LEGE 07203]MBE9096395.1 polyprenyl synthetase family protein [Tychonema sp. LEGE 07203]